MRGDQSGKPGGDDTRQWGPPFVTRDEDVTASYFHSTNRGKASVTVDFRTEEGQAQVKELLADADILIENFKTGDWRNTGWTMPACPPSSRN